MRHEGLIICPFTLMSCIGLPLSPWIKFKWCGIEILAPVHHDCIISLTGGALSNASKVVAYFRIHTRLGE